MNGRIERASCKQLVNIDCQATSRRRRKPLGMKNRRVFQRADCSIPAVVHARSRFLYGEVVDLSLGGVRLALREELEPESVELSPNKAIPEGVIVIPLPYDRAWQKSGEKPEVGLQFAGGTDAFFRGWLADHLGSLFTTPDALLDHRRLVRVPCQMDGTARVDEQDFPCAFIDLSLGGVSFIVPREAFPGETLQVWLDNDEFGLGILEVILLRVQTLRGHSLCGGRFLEPDESQVSILEKLVQGLSQEHEAPSVEG